MDVCHNIGTHFGSLHFSFLMPLQVYLSFSCVAHKLLDARMSIPPFYSAKRIHWGAFFEYNIVPPAATTSVWRVNLPLFWTLRGKLYTPVFLLSAYSMLKNITQTFYLIFLKEKFNELFQAVPTDIPPFLFLSAHYANVLELSAFHNRFRTDLLLSIRCFFYSIVNSLDTESIAHP